MGGKEFPLLGNNLTAILAGPAVRQLFSRRLQLADGPLPPTLLEGDIRDKVRLTYVKWDTKALHCWL
jgi:hypothetical protein